MNHRTDITNTKLEYFRLGPFTVQCSPNYYECYTRYTILANGVPVRDQISYPEVEDGWQGLSFTKANRKEELTAEEKEALLHFHTQQHRRQIT